MRNNTLRNVSLNRKTGFLRHPGAIALFAYKVRGYVVQPGGHRDITIEGNTFEENDGVDFWCVRWMVSPSATISSSGR